MVYWATVCKTVRPMLSDRCPVCLSLLSVLSVCSVRSVALVHCDQTVGWIKMKPGMQVALGPGHTVLDRDPAPPPQKGHSLSPQFLAHICCVQIAGWIKMPLGMEIGLVPGDFVLDGDPNPLPKRADFRPVSGVAKRLDGSR